MRDPLFKIGGEVVAQAALRDRCRAVDLTCEVREEMADGVDFFIDRVAACGGTHPVKVGGEFVTTAKPPEGCLAVYEEHDSAKKSVCRQILAVDQSEVGIDICALVPIDSNHPNAREYFSVRNDILNALTMQGTVGFASVTP